MTEPAPHAVHRGRLLISASALLWGVQFAFLNPAIGLVLVTVYDATPGQVGLALAAYNVSGFVSTLVVPTWADRSGDYVRPMLWCGVFTIALATALAFSSTLPAAVVALVALGGPAGVGIGLLFAHQRAGGARARDVMRTRAVFSFAWVAGPPVAAFLMGWFGNRSILWAVALVAVVSLGVTWGLMTVRGPGGVRPADVGERLVDTVRRPVVAVLVIGFVMLQATNSAAVAALPLLVTQKLGLGVEWAGIALGVAAGLEIPVLLALGSLSGRVGLLRLLVVGGLFGVGYYAVMTVATTPVVLVGAQALNAVFVATVSGIGLTLFQDVVGRPGLASGLFMNTYRVGAIVAGPVVAIGGLRGLGYAGVFAVCGGLVVAGLGLLVVGTGRAQASVEQGDVRDADPVREVGTDEAQ